MVPIRDTKLPKEITSKSMKFNITSFSCSFFKACCYNSTPFVPCEISGKNDDNNMKEKQTNQRTRREKDGKQAENQMQYDAING